MWLLRCKETVATALLAAAAKLAAGGNRTCGKAASCRWQLQSNARPGNGTSSKVVRVGVGLCRCPRKHILKALLLDAVLAVYFHKTGSDSHATVWASSFKDLGDRESLSRVANHELMVQKDRRPNTSTKLNTQLLHTVHVLCRGVDQPYVLTIRTCRQADKSLTPRVQGQPHAA